MYLFYLLGMITLSLLFNYHLIIQINCYCILLLFFKVYAILYVKMFTGRGCTFKVFKLPWDVKCANTIFKVFKLLWDVKCANNSVTNSVFLIQTGM